MSQKYQQQPPAGLKSRGSLLVSQDYSPKPPKSLTVKKLLDKIEQLLEDGLITADSEVYLCCQDPLTDIDHSPSGNLDLC